ncbi:NAD(P)-dependent oxidoreductase [Pseudaminobacter sp. 19-2017]|uniref:NAD(P)-dependent oxidoreductase n=1 Tax=Pseudaminobacter soli (ex Zhang et al. 2022) TaxID=2831468 RepID=A0A942E0C1_9HYPH|nr:NAD(P)-dependent oxidoreductase [Pseudaminobacter soli]MBS3648270.1 NAD(P)-dependent oxidoreductase [Pseudaminobacter soli]
MRYGFIGLGSLGGSLALNLVRAGFRVVVHDLDRANAAPHLTAGAEWADSLASLAAASDAVITCLPSPVVSERLLRALLPSLAKGSTWIEMSTLGRDDILRLAAVANEYGVDTLELPVTGGVHLAARGEITLLAGGDAEIIARHQPALDAIGGRLFHMGPLGSAAVIKVITNMLAFIHLVADGEALMLAKRGGLDLAKAWEAIRASSGNSFVHETEGQLILSGSYDVGFTMDLALKDLGFAAVFGRDFGVPLDLAGLTLQTFERARAAYGGSEQSTAVVRLLEDALGTDLRAPGFPARLE